MTESLIQDLLLILSSGLIAALFCRRIGASVLIGYLIVGALLGRGVLGWIQDDSHELEHFAEAGVFLLLFSIGLEFSLDDLKRLGRGLVVGGGAQMGLVALPVGLILVGLGLDWRPACLIAAAVSFSSTVLVFKSLSEWGHSSSPAGRRAIGILLFQDAALVPLLLLVPLLTGSDQTPGPWQYARLLVVSVLFVAAVITLRYGLGRWGIPAMARYRSPELITLFTIVSLGTTTLIAHSVGLPPAVGAFAAGLIFNGNRWTAQIDALVLPFRETFAAVFFVGLGLIFDPTLYWTQPGVVITGLVVVIGLKTLAAAAALMLTGMARRESFAMAIGLAHVGEFAFVLVLLGVESNVIGESNYQSVVAIAVGSLILTPPLMKFGLRRIAGDAGSVSDATELATGTADPRRAAIIGAGPIGMRLASHLETTGLDVCLFDLSPINLHPFAQAGFRTIAGNATEIPILHHGGVQDCGLVVICVADDATAKFITRSVRQINSECHLIVRCRYQSNADRLRALGGDVVITEETEAAVALVRETSRSLS